MGKCIVKENGFVIKDMNDFSTSILVDGSINYAPNPERLKNYRLLSNNVDFYWGTKDFEIPTLVISYKGTILEVYENPNFQLVVDFLNKYDNLSITHIIKVVDDLQKDYKSKLEQEIESLQVEKEKLLEQVTILKRLEEKSQEIRNLLNDFIQ